MPGDPQELRRAIVERPNSRAVTLDALLGWAWDAGIVVLPLAKAPDFVAAVWLVDETPVVVLPESRAFGAHWLFDLAHELGHLALGHVRDRGIVDVDDPESLTDSEERAANEFALALLLGDADELLAEVRRRTRNDAARYFKPAVVDDWQPGAAASVDRSVELIGTAHVTHENPISWL